MAGRVKGKTIIEEIRETITTMAGISKEELVQAMKQEQQLILMIGEDQDLETEIDSKIEDRAVDNSRIKEEMKETPEDE